MTFSSEKPTVPGAYWFRDRYGDTELVEVYSVHDCDLLYFLDEYGERFAVVDDDSLLWTQRLVPVEEVEKAWREGAAFGLSAEKPLQVQMNWALSRAKRIFDGKE